MRQNCGKKGVRLRYKQGVAEFRSPTELEPPVGNHRLHTLGSSQTMRQMMFAGDGMEVM